VLQAESLFDKFAPTSARDSAHFVRVRRWRERLRVWRGGEAFFYSLIRQEN
jgi:hypothetical protein